MNDERAIHAAIELLGDFDSELFDDTVAYSERRQKALDARAALDRIMAEKEIMRRLIKDMLQTQIKLMRMHFRFTSDEWDED